mmetsp:Transcript_3510/g.8496  ORF Transcript_3510/g.8496 Transcript_3510/m.8496 type:complete len:292 (-) Transcript_3510:2-877(-)
MKAHGRVHQPLAYARLDAEVRDEDARLRAQRRVLRDRGVRARPWHRHLERRHTLDRPGPVPAERNRRRSRHGEAVGGHVQRPRRLADRRRERRRVQLAQVLLPVVREEAAARHVILSRRERLVRRIVQPRPRRRAARDAVGAARVSPLDREGRGAGGDVHAAVVGHVRGAGRGDGLRAARSAQQAAGGSLEAAQRREVLEAVLAAEAAADDAGLGAQHRVLLLGGVLPRAGAFEVREVWLVESAGGRAPDAVLGAALRLRRPDALVVRRVAEHWRAGGGFHARALRLRHLL